MKEQFDTITKGFEVTLKRTTIKLILGGLLYMGNTLNAGNKTRGQADGCEVAVLPAWRPDKAMAVDNTKTYNEYINMLAAAADIKINSFTSFIAALDKRHQFFHDNGCRLSDHGLETFIAEDYTDVEIGQIFKKIRGGADLSSSEVLKFKSCMLYEFGIMDHSCGWTQQFHVRSES